MSFRLLSEKVVNYQFQYVFLAERFFTNTSSSHTINSLGYTAAALTISCVFIAEH